MKLPIQELHNSVVLLFLCDDDLFVYNSTYKQKVQTTYYQIPCQPCPQTPNPLMRMIFIITRTADYAIFTSYAVSTSFAKSIVAKNYSPFLNGKAQSAVVFSFIIRSLHLRAVCTHVIYAHSIVRKT